MKVFYLFIFSLVFSFLGQGQSARLDSLKRVLKEVQVDTTRLEVYHELVKAYKYRSSDSMCVYAEKGLELANRSNNLMWSAIFNHDKATCLERIGTREEAIAQYLIAKKIFEKLKDTINLMKTHATLLSRYGDIGQLDTAIEHYEFAIALLPKDKPAMRANINNRIGVIYANMGKLELAKRHFNFNLAIYKKLNRNYELAFTNMNIGIMHAQLGVYPDSTQFYLEEGLKYHRLVNRPQALANNLAELGAFYLNKEDYKNALTYIQESITIMEPINAPFFIGDKYAKLATIYNKLDRHSDAITVAKKGLEAAEKTQEYIVLKTVLDILASSYYSEGDYKEAYGYKDRSIAIRDSLFSQENKQTIASIEKDYEIKQKEGEIDLQSIRLSRQRILILSISGIAILLIALVFLLIRVSKQRKKTNYRLKELDQTKSRFFANISHELRTPLTLILGPIENAISKVKSVSAKKDLELAHRNSKKLLTIVNGVLDLSKLESGKLTLIEHPVTLEKLLRRIFFSYHSLAQLRGFILSFNYHLEEDLVVKLDIEKFESVVNNLLSNAFKHSQSGGVITLKAGKEKGHLKIEIKDTGKGIPSGSLAKIFERFYQMEGTDEPLQGGTGIGLAYARELAQLFGGSLEVESEMNKGSNFIFRLPMKKTTTTPVVLSPLQSDEKSVAAIAPLSGDKTHILIVEDNPDMSLFLEESLSPYFQCTIAMDGNEAIKLLENNLKPDLITSDIMMPNMDGFTFLEHVKTLKTLRHVPFILLTARAMEDDKLKGLRMGVDDYLTKPFRPKELVVRINNLLKNKKVREGETIDKETLIKDEVGYEEKFIRKAETLVLNHLSDKMYRIPDLAKDLAYSPRQLERILKRVTGLAPVEFVREVRLQKAYEFLEKRRFATIAEVRMEVGMENASYFTKRVQERFGKTPKEIMMFYQKENAKNAIE